MKRTINSGYYAKTIEDFLFFGPRTRMWMGIFFGKLGLVY